MTAATRPRLPALDALRGIAVLLVLVHHLTPFDYPTRWHQAWGAVAHVGWAGVDLFLVLSGFLITGILLDGRDAPGRARLFWSRRARRILPLYYVTLFLLVVVVPQLGTVGAALTRNLVAAQAWFWTHLSNVLMAREGFMFSGASHFWSLAVEEQFYLVWPFVVWRTSLATLRRLCLAVIAAAPLLRLGSFLLTGSAMPAYVLTPLRADALAAGALVALAARDPALRAWFFERREHLIIISAGALLPLPLAGDSWSHPYTFTIGYSALAILFAGVVGSAVLAPESPSMRWLAARRGVPRQLQRVGIISYGLYVLHVPVYSYLGWAGWGPAAMGQTAFYLVASTISVALAAASWRWLEQPILDGRWPWQRPARRPALASVLE